MEVPLVFSPFLQHEDVASAMKNKVYAAGFCQMDKTGKWMVSGASVSLKLDARQQDAKILNEHLGATYLSLHPPCQEALAAH